MARQDSGPPEPDASGNTRDRIKSVAAELYVLRGHEGFSFGDIAASIGTTRANIHHHFGSKQQLMGELIEDIASNAEARIERYWMAGDAAFAERLSMQLDDLRRYYERFNKGDQETSFAFLKWLDSAETNMRFSIATGDLPLRQSSTKLPAYKDFLNKYPANKVFVDNLKNNVTKSRPNIIEYPKISQALGQAIQAVLLGAEPKAALDKARDAVDRILAGS
jgi:AcrR family transcriptional regulator